MTFDLRRIGTSDSFLTSQLKSLWSLNPLRTTLMVSLNIARSLFPAIRGYSQVRSLVSLYSHPFLTVPSGFDR